MYLFKILILFSLDVYPEIRLLDHMVFVFSILKNLFILIGGSDAEAEAPILWPPDAMC